MNIHTEKDKILVKLERPKNANRVSNIQLIGVILAIALLGLIIMIIFEKYFTPFMANKILLRVVLLGIIINICIMFFLIYSFSKVSFEIGPRGPTGIRGLQGPIGMNAEINRCSKQTKTITKERNDRIRAKTIVVQKPAIILD